VPHRTWKEVVKWGHLVYLSNGPVLLIRAEEQRVLFGFWRGKRLQALEQRLKRALRREYARSAHGLVASVRRKRRGYPLLRGIVQFHHR
jgi:hypothetical protein